MKVKKIGINRKRERLHSSYIASGIRQMFQH